jgi:protocatechuate 3,4-dioxygenase beta subunit
MKVSVIFLLTALLLQAAPQSNVGTVQGEITRATTNDPIRDVRVTLQQAVATGTRIAPRTAVSDSEGRFSFDEVPAGRYTVSVAREGFSTSPGNTSEVTLNAGRTINVKLSLVPDSVVRGRILDASGQLVTNATVEAFALIHQNGIASLRSVASKMSDDRGEYRLFGLAPGEYYVAATPPAPVAATAAGVGSVRNVGTFFPASATAGDAEFVTVSAGQDLSAIDIVLQSNLQVIVSGRVVNGLIDRSAANTDPTPAGETTVLANLTLVPRSREIVELPNAEAMTRVTLKGIAAGFEIRGVVPGQYDLFALMDTPQGSAVAKAAVTVVDRDVTGLTLIVQRGVDIYGAVTVDGNAVSQIPYIALRPTDSLSRTGMGIAAAPRAEVRGGFSVAGVPEGHFRFEMNPPGNTYLDDIVLNGASIYDSGFDVHSGSSRDPIEVRLKTGAAILEGTVVEADGKALVGATMAIVPVSRRSNPALFRAGITNAAGRFTLNGIAPGEYKLFAWSWNVNGAYFNPAFLGKYEENAHLMVVAPGSRTTLTVTALERR